MPDFLSPSEYFHGKKSRPRKRFGQHFLVQPATAEKIVQSAGLREGDAAVEIGPGLGALTRFLLPEVRVLHLIEVDREISEYLRERIPPEKMVIYEQDALSFDFRNLADSERNRLVVLGNLPYSISSPLMFHLLECFPAIGRAVFMVQKEVGMRFAASPGGKDYGVLSVLLGIYSKVRILFSVGPRQFYPPPKVDSIVLRIDFAEKRPDGPEFEFLRQAGQQSLSADGERPWGTAFQGFSAFPSALSSTPANKPGLTRKGARRLFQHRSFLPSPGLFNCKLSPAIGCKIPPLC